MNDLSKVVDKLLAQGLLALRGICVMPRLVNSDHSNLAAQQEVSIDVPIPSAIKAQAVTPGDAPQETGDISPVGARLNHRPAAGAGRDAGRHRQHLHAGRGEKAA